MAAESRSGVIKWVRVAFVACAVMSLSLPLDGQRSEPSPSIWPNLSAGPFGVGYSVVHQYDYSRSFKKKYDYFGDRVAGELGRPVQISIWYPAEVPAGVERMRYGEYFHALLTEVDFGHPSAERVRSHLERHKRILMAEWGVEPGEAEVVKARLDSLFSAQTFAVRDATPAADAFPLVLHLPGYNGSAPDHIPLFEYLASHGFVVAAVPNGGANSRNIDNESRSLDVQARDLEFAYAYMRSLPYVDAERLGTTGMSWGGMSNILFAARNSYVDAAVTLDGAITMPEELNLIEAVPGYSHAAFDAAYLQLMVAPEQATFRPKDVRFFAALKYSDAYMIQFSGVQHDDFSPGYVRLRNLAETDEAKIAYLEAFERAICDYTRQFFAAFLKGDSVGRQYLAATPVANGLPDGMVARSESKSALRKPPTRDEFAQIIRERGVDAAEQIYRDTRLSDPEVVLITSPVMGPLYMEAMNAGRLEEALAICNLWASGMPDDAGPLFSLARVYLAMESEEEAVAAYEKVLTLVQEGPQAERARAAIAEIRGRR